MLSNFKDLSDKTLMPIAKTVGKLGFKPNQLTLLGLILMAGSGYMIAYDNILEGIVLLMFGGFCDMMDGLLARSMGIESKMGGFLDAFTDRYADTFVIGGMLLLDDLENQNVYGISGHAWAIGALTGALLTSYARAAAERSGVSQQGVGMIERPERLALIMIFLAIGEFTAIMEVAEAAVYVLAILTVLGHLTVLQRLVHFLQKSEKNEG